MALLRKKVETNEKDLFELRSKLIERNMRGGAELEAVEKPAQPRPPDMDYSVATKKNLVRLKKDLQHFKNEMRRSLSANESGVQQRLESLNRSIRHVQSRQTCQK